MKYLGTLYLKYITPYHHQILHVIKITSGKFIILELRKGFLKAFYFIPSNEIVEKC